MIPRELKNFTFAEFLGYDSNHCPPACIHLESCKIINGKDIKITNPKFPAYHLRLPALCPISFAQWVYIDKEETPQPEEDFPEPIFIKTQKGLTYIIKNYETL
jgi:hypothetical protein